MVHRLQISDFFFLAESLSLLYQSMADPEPGNPRTKLPLIFSVT